MKHQTSITTPLGDKKLLLRRFTYSEQLGRLFRLEAELLSPDHNIPFKKIVGEHVTVAMALANGKTRYFNGVVSAFSQSAPQGRYACYRATIMPWLWLLTRTSDCRIFQEKSVPDIIKKVMKELGFSDIKDDLKATYPKWTYCVQYRESDFNFVSRLMEQEGIYYYWKHEKNKHHLVLVDDPAAHEPYPGYNKIKFRPEHEGFSGGEDISEWTLRQEVQPGLYALTDYNFEKPKSSLAGKSTIRRPHAKADYEIFDYPGEYDQHADAGNYTKIRIQELQAQHEIVEGQSDARGLAAGSIFDLTDHTARKDQNRTYLLLGVHYTVGSEQYEGGSAGTLRFQCAFQAMDAKSHFRPARVTPKPIVQGPQTAVVTGPPGEEIYTNPQAQVKVQFHWDRYGKRDQNTTCWIRVSQPWAGKGWGSQSTPRIGQEVIVEFLEGDPDQPIITGRVYNGDNPPPYGKAGVVSGLKSQTHKGAGSNEMSLDDTAGAEEVKIHGQYNMNTVVEHDQTSTIHNNRTDKVDVDDSETVGNNQTLHVVKNRTKNVDVDENETIGSNKTINVGSNHAETIGKNMTLTVAMNKAETVGIASAETVGAAKALTVGAAYQVSVGGLMNETVGAAKAVQVAMSSSETVGQTSSLKAKKVTITADDEIAIKVGGAQILMKSNGDILIKGNNIKIKGTKIEEN